MTDDSKKSTKKKSSLKKTSKPKLLTKQRLWETSHASMVVSVDPGSKETFVVRRINKRELSAPEAEEITDRIKAIGQREFPGILKVYRVAASSKEIVVLLTGTTGETYADLLADPKNREEGLNRLWIFSKQLDELHKQGIVHGDLRPENLFLVEPNQYLASSFAPHHALHHWSANDHQLSTDVIGKYAPDTYNAPELKESKQADAQSDQYTLACIYLETILGKRLSPAETPIKLSSLLPKHYQKSVQPVFAKAFSPEPAERFSSCEEFHDTLTAALRTSRPSKFARRMKKLFAALFILPLILVPMTKWLMVRNEQSRLNAKVLQTKEAELAELAKQYAADVRVPQNVQMLAGLSNSPSDRTFYLEYYSKIEERREAERKDLMKAGHEREMASFTRWKSQFSSNISSSVNLPSSSIKGKRAFIFSDSGSLIAEGSDSLPIEISFRGITLPDFLLDEVSVVFKVSSSSSSGLSERLKLKSSSTSPTVNFEIPPPNKKWNSNDKFTLSVEVQNPFDNKLEKITSSKIHSELNVGTVEWISSPLISISPSEARRTLCQIPSSMNVQTGEKLKISVDGRVAPFSKTIHQKFRTEGSREAAFGFPTIGPDGVKAVATVFLTSNTKYYTVHEDRDHWGALIMKIGSKGNWIIPTIQSQPLLAKETGQLYFGINSLSHLVKDRQKESLFNETYWHPSGEFKVSVERQAVDIKSSVSSKARAAIIRQLR